MMRIAVVGWLGVCLSLTATADAPSLTYQQPPAPIPAILDAQGLPAAAVSPDGRWILLSEQAMVMGIDELAQTSIGLAGERVNPQTNDVSWPRPLKSIQLLSVADGAARTIQIDAGKRIKNPQWSADSKHIAFTVVADQGLELWVAEAATGQARRLSGAHLNGAASATPCSWLPSGKGLVCQLLPAARGAIPQAPRVPSGPVVQETDGSENVLVWTLANMLTSPTDEALFEYYFTTQLAIVGLDGTVTAIGQPGIHREVKPSPDERYFMVRTAHRPYSHLIGVQGFPTRTAIWNASGRSVREIADTPLQEIMDNRGRVLQGPRQPVWRADAAATLVWAEALDGGDPDRKASKRDRLLALAAPFDRPPQPLFEAEYRLFGFNEPIVWVRQDLALVTETWWPTRRTRTWAINPNTAAKPRLVFERGTQDRYANPGTPAMRMNKQGAWVAQTTAAHDAIYLIGNGASPEGERPFLDRLDLKTLRTSRLWQVEGSYYENVVAVLNGDASRLLTQRESPKDPPNYFVRERKSGHLKPLTSYQDQAPAFADVSAQLLTYQREDGVSLSATLYLPPGYKKTDGPLPFLFKAYPSEFKDVAGASQVKASPHRFKRPDTLFNDHLFVLTQGYGVLDDPTMPIIGEGEAQPNDTYVQQLVASAKAAVEKVVSMGVADRDRIAVTGHSYGSFMTVNLLVHSDLFRTGIARSGASNRTLTPFGFQAETRTLWQARDTYINMSPFIWIDRLNEPLLIIHGQDDDNPGTLPIHADRLYAAIKNNKGVARYVQLPFEGHGYYARESVAHVAWETVRWMDRYVKHAPPRTAGTLKPN